MFHVADTWSQSYIMQTPKHSTKTQIEKHMIQTTIHNWWGMSRICCIVSSHSSYSSSRSHRYWRARFFIHSCGSRFLFINICCCSCSWWWCWRSWEIWRMNSCRRMRTLVNGIKQHCTAVTFQSRIFWWIAVISAYISWDISCLM